MPDHDHSEADAERARVADADRAFHELAERIALAGFVLTIVDGDAPFVVSRWGLVRGFATLADAERFLATVTGRRP
jgi:hypothetical protein